MSIQGGYAGYNGSPTTDTRNEISILSGDLNNNDPTVTDNASIIVLIPSGMTTPSQSGSNFADKANLDGFEITAARNGVSGGGIYADTSSTTAAIIRDCKIHNNHVSSYGGGYASHGDGANVTFRNCEIYNNSAGSEGGGLYGEGTLRVLNCSVHDNTVAQEGGGILCVGTGTSLQVVSSTIANNETTGSISTGGAGIYMRTFSSTAEVVNCTLVGNETAGNGGGIAVFASTTLEMTNCTLSANTAGSSGGGVYISTTSGTSNIENSILWDNSAPTGKEITLGAGALNVSYSDVRDRLGAGVSGSVTFGSGNIGENTTAHNPNFVGTSTSNYRLKCPSPAIDVALDSNVPADAQDVNEDSNTSQATFDRDIQVRIIPDTTGDTTEVDMGAYETDVETGTCIGDADSDCDVDVDDLLAVINSWGTCPTPPAACLGDLHPPNLGCNSGDGDSDVDDLLVVINNWGSCICDLNPSDEDSMPTSVSDCMDVCDGEYTPFSDDWDECVNKCVEGLCEAEIIDCD